MGGGGGASLGGEKNIIVRMPRGGQVNTLKGKQTGGEAGGRSRFLAAADQSGGWGKKREGSVGCKSVIAGAC